MKTTFSAYLELLVDEIQEMDPKFRHLNVKSLQELMENVDIKDVPPEAVVGD